MALRLVLVFRLVSPLSGHSHVAGRRGRPTLFPNLGPVRHTSLEFQSQKLFSLEGHSGASARAHAPWAWRHAEPDFRPVWMEVPDA